MNNLNVELNKLNYNPTHKDWLKPLKHTTRSFLLVVAGSLWPTTAKETSIVNIRDLVGPPAGSDDLRQGSGMNGTKTKL